MTAPVLKDLMGKDFTEGDRVVHSTVNGMRVGMVTWIKELPTGPWHPAGDPPPYKVYISLKEHNELPQRSPGKMLAQKMGYEYKPQHFLKV